MSKWILPFEGIGRTDVSVAGGKGANLGELVGKGFPVPPGFVVSADACQSFFKDINLHQEIAQFSNTHPDTWGIVARYFRERFMPQTWMRRSQVPFCPHMPI